MLQLHLTYALKVFIGLFAIINPFLSSTVFLSIAGSKGIEEQKSISKKACLVAFITLTLFIIFGNQTLDLFGLSISAFNIAGGIIIFFVGFELLQSKDPHIQTPNDLSNSKKQKDNKYLAVSPLAIPILAGPGSIVTVMNYSTKVGMTYIITEILILAITLSIVCIFFILSSKLIKIFGENCLMVISKIMGLILSVIGIEMILQGIKSTFKL